MDKLDEALEMARCAEINLENMVDMMPVLKMHPLLGILKFQIEQCVRDLEEVVKEIGKESK